MIEWIISSSVLIAIIIALRYILRGKISLRLQYALWGLVLLRLLIPFNIGSSSFSVMNVLPEDVPGAVLSPAAPDSAYTGPEGTNPAQSVPAVPSGTSSAAVQGEPEISYSDGVTDVLDKATDWGSIAKMVWLAGVAVMGLGLLLSNLRLAGKLKRSRRALAIEGCRLPVYLSDAVDTPCLFGVFRPSIYVTPEAAESETKLRHVLAHEMTHLRHGDNLWALLRGVCLALHWYNPLVWWAAVLSRNDAELACDEATIKRIGESERAEYGRTLIAMTCQKRPALLNTATTMTGGKHGIRERITLIVKKPKMAVYTLIAVVLIAAVAVGCTFTGAKDGEVTADADVTLYDCGGLTVAIPNEYVDLLTVQTGDELEDDTVLISVYEKASEEAAAADGIDNPGLGWLFSLIRYDETLHNQYARESNDGLFFFAKDDEWYYGYYTATDVRFYHSDEDSLEAALTQWKMLNEQVGPSVRDDFIERNALTPYSESNHASGSNELNISVEAQGNIPTAVLEFAQDYVSQTVSAWNGDAAEHPGTTITQAKITGLKRINTGTAGLAYGQDLWLLEYRLLPEDPDSVTLAEGMRMELIDGQNWLTEWNSSGQPCLLLYYEDDGDLTVWERVCATYTGVIEQDFGTPEMLDQYGNIFTAAAMELYASYLEQNGSAGKSAAAALDASLSRLILDYYRDYDQQRVYFQGDEPGVPREGDCRIESVTYLGGTRLYEVMGVAYEISRSSYNLCNGELGWQVWQPTILIVTRGVDGICDRVLGSTDNTSGMALNDIIRQVSWGLSDLDVALWRDGYPNPAGPGTEVPFYNAAYDGPATIEVLENAEPVYNEGDYWAQHSWAGFEALCYHSAAGDVYSVYAINTTRTDLSTYREIRVGDSREAVLAAYPELKSGEYWNNYPGNYWETQPGEDCMWYCDDPNNLGPALLFFFKGGKVSRIVLNHLVD